MIQRVFWCLLCSMMVSVSVAGQGSSGQVIGQNTVSESTDRLNTITTAVPFLLIAPDTRSGAIGDCGVASSHDASAIHWNPAKLGFAENELGFAVSYTPWLKKLVNDINLSYLAGYKQIDKYQVIGASLRYFTLGNIQFTDEYGNEIRQYRPNEFAIDVAYARKLSENFAGGLAIRYINSNLTGGTSVGGATSKPGRSVAADVSAYYQKDDIKLGERTGELAAGINISNIGNKMSYTSTSKRDFIPINLRLGPRFTYNIDEFNTIAITVDFNKLLVPTAPVYKTDSNGQVLTDDEGNLEIAAGKDPNRAVANGMFGSFTDAPGNPVLDQNSQYVYNTDGSVQIEKNSRFREEMREIMWAVGLEYWYNDQFTLRGGYFWEHELKGNRKYFTLGAGIRYNVFGLDFSYLIPAYFGSNSTQQSPLQNTVRFTLTFDFEAFKKQQEGDIN
ncbi:MAG: hypothetical protein COA57_06145 [Flavobacteriales bacterium]|nr:MAG: hypothetical protein COA57_06145 [Flavobacteriales bacterium]